MADVFFLDHSAAVEGATPLALEGRSALIGSRVVPAEHVQRYVVSATQLKHVVTVAPEYLVEDVDGTLTTRFRYRVAWWHTAHDAAKSQAARGARRTAGT